MSSLIEWKVPPAAQPRAGKLFVRSRARAVLGGRPACHHPVRRLYRRNARRRARRQWRADRRRSGADRRLSHHRSRNHLAASRRRPGRAGPCARLRSRDRLRPGAGSRAASICRCWRSVRRRPPKSARASWSAAPAAVRARSPAASPPSSRLPATGNIIWTRRFSLSGASELGRHRLDLVARRVDRHRFAADRARRRRRRRRKSEHLNMTIPIDLLKPILEDLKTFGRVNKPARPWLGLVHHRDRRPDRHRRRRRQGPAARAEIKTGDMIIAVAGQEGFVAGRFLPRRLGARRCRRRGAADLAPRRRHLRRAGQFIRPREVSQRAADALSVGEPAHLVSRLPRSHRPGSDKTPDGP